MINTSTQPIIQSIPNALEIPYVNADEAYTLLENEFERFSQLLEKLKQEDWEKPTACTAWTVKDMLAHQAGGYASGSQLPRDDSPIHYQTSKRPTTGGCRQ